jgi:hypothetical protein
MEDVLGRVQGAFRGQSFCGNRSYETCVLYMKASGKMNLSQPLHSFYEPSGIGWCNYPMIAFARL